MSTMILDVKSAKQFLLNRLVERASKDGTLLSDVEKRMFLFSESAPETDWQANTQFESESDSDKYEEKIANLLRSAYAEDQKIPSREADWNAALEALKDEDFYGLVMVDQAGIARPQFHVPLRSLFSPKLVLLVVSELAVLLIAAALFFDRVPFFAALPDWSRLAGIGLCALAFWKIGKAWRVF